MDLQSKYKKLDHREHVLSRPGMYIGSVEEDTYNTWVFCSDTKRMIKKEIRFIPGLYKIFDEILVNVIDHGTRLKSIEGSNKLKTIKVTIDRVTGTITVFNDGDGIEVEKHPEHKIYIPELIFGNLLTSTNYDDNEEKIIGGQNGIGAKACNIFSKSFTIETVDASRKKLYHQEFTNNMSENTTPTVKYCAKKPYTSITFVPDYERFKMQVTDGMMMPKDVYDLFVKRCYDVCALTDADVSVWLNGEKLEVKTFERYVDLYLGPKGEHPRVYQRVNDRWEIIASYTDTIGFEQVSFVNGIWTLKGGKHVDYIVNQITSKICEASSKKKKDADLKPTHVKNFLIVFIKSTITNPSFDSQSKDALTTPMSKFGSRADLDDAFIDKLYKTDLVAKALTLSEKNIQAGLKKTDGKKHTKIRGLIKLDDANLSGSGRSKECVLILTEGDSAKSTAMSGLSVVGRDLYGVFPLRGKVLNVKDITAKKLMENEEIQNIKKIMGLESGKDYKTLDDLRYGRVMIMSDQDHDGSHIRGLIMNMFGTLWPSLTKIPGFITSLLTPIIKVSNKSKSETKAFYNMVDYNRWSSEQPDGAKGWHIKYYKGLGTSNDIEARDYFRNMHLVHYDHDGKESDDVMDLAFNKKRADDRKQWLSNYDPEATVVLTKNEEHLTYQDFINRELIHFSVYDVKRSIPSIVDGLKPSQRKIMYCCFKRNQVDEVKVAQLAGYVSEHAAYHHGEASLQGAIVCMAQDFMGANNINLLHPSGMFGTRRLGGKDASAPRYIFTYFDPITLRIFKKEDSSVLTYLEDDGYRVEPEFYAPIVPTVLINGACGIGTGFSTSISCYNPSDVFATMREVITESGVDDEMREKINKLAPWYRGFTGTIERAGPSAFTSHGRYVKINDKTVEIVELPVGTWTEDYKAFLEEYLEKNPKVLKDYETHSTNHTIRFILQFYPGELPKLMDDGGFEKEFKLVTKTMTTSNMHLFDADGRIKKYETVADIVTDFYKVRRSYYVKRKDAVIAALEDEMEVLGAKVRMIEEVTSSELKVMGVSRANVEEQLKKRNYPSRPSSGGYEYLMKMPVYTFTTEKRDELKAELQKKRDEHARYTALSIEEIWLDELDELEKEYTAFLDRKAANELGESNGMVSSGKKKKAPAKKLR